MKNGGYFVTQVNACQKSGGQVMFTLKLINLLF